MTQASICIIILLLIGVACLLVANSKEKKEIKLFMLFATFVIFIFGVIAETKAEPLSIYAGGDFGLDWPHEDDRNSPLCAPGGLDGFASNGRLYIGLSQEVNSVTFYGEFAPWLHKSCALVTDSNVLDGFQFIVGARAEFRLFK